MNCSHEYYMRSDGYVACKWCNKTWMPVEGDGTVEDWLKDWE